ncbi:hypothetical protein [Bacillus alkalisoli]|nr:hypothetical protein [Bacillus alkalisoli]
MDIEYELDTDWIKMIIEAKEMGMTREEISQALMELNKIVK